MTSLGHFSSEAVGIIRMNWTHPINHSNQQRHVSIGICVSALSFANFRSSELSAHWPLPPSRPGELSLSLSAFEVRSELARFSVRVYRVLCATKQYLSFRIDLPFRFFHPIRCATSNCFDSVPHLRNNFRRNKCQKAIELCRRMKWERRLGGTGAHQTHVSTSGEIDQLTIELEIEPMRARESEKAFIVHVTTRSEWKTIYGTRSSIVLQAQLSLFLCCAKHSLWCGNLVDNTKRHRVGTLLCEGDRMNNDGQNVYASSIFLHHSAVISGDAHILFRLCFTRRNRHKKSVDEVGWQMISQTPSLSLSLFYAVVSTLTWIRDRMAQRHSHIDSFDWISFYFWFCESKKKCKICTNNQSMTRSFLCLTVACVHVHVPFAICTANIS